MSFASRDNRLYWYIGGAMLLTVFICLLAVSCSPRPAYAPGYPAAVVGAAPTVVQPGYAPAPVVVAAPVHHDGFFTGMLAGSLLSNRNTHTTVVQQAPVTTTAPAQRYAPSQTYSQAPRPAPTFQSSSTVNTRGITTTTTSRSTSFGTRRR